MELIDLRYDKADAIATITLDREAASNAYSEAMVDSLERALNQAEADDEVRAVIITGAGRAFSAGGDVKAMLERSGMFEGGPAELRERYQRGIHRIPRRVASFEKPLIAAINGPAVGAGLDLACMCDLRIASTRARFGSTFVKIGLIPGDGGAYFLSRVVGMPHALELMLTGRLIQSDEAARIGLVQRVVPDEELASAALKTAQQIAQNAPLAVRLTKVACYQAQHMTIEQALAAAATYQGIAQNTEDHLEGVRALLEKRPAHFQDR